MRTLPTGFKQVSDLNEIIFAHRNKKYGAYELRKHYNDRLLKAFLITTSSTLLLLLVSLVIFRNPPQINGDPFVANHDSIKTFVFEEVKVREVEHKKDTKTDQPSTLIVNDTLRERKEKHDSLTTQSVGNNSSLNGDSSSIGAKTGKGGIAVDTFSKAVNAEPPFRVIAQVMPSFPGGEGALSRYIQRHFSCDGSSANGGRSEGKIILRFVIMKDGSLLQVEVLRNNVGPDCMNQVKNILLNSPKWNPGLQNNQPVNVQMVLPITIERQ